MTYLSGGMGACEEEAPVAAAAAAAAVASAAVLEAAARLLANERLHDVTFKCSDNDATVTANRSYLMVSLFQKQKQLQPSCVITAHGK